MIAKTVFSALLGTVAMTTLLSAQEIRPGQRNDSVLSPSNVAAPDFLSSPDFRGSLSTDGNPVGNIPTPIKGSDPANKEYIDQKFEESIGVLATEMAKINEEILVQQELISAMCLHEETGITLLGGGGLISSGGGGAGTAILGKYDNAVNQNETGNQSPAKMTPLADGRMAYVWVNNALADNSTTMRIQVRIFNADGTPAGNQVSLDTAWSVDGNDAYDWDNLQVNGLPNGNLLISYVRSSVEAGADAPVFSILNPSLIGTPAQYVVRNGDIQTMAPFAGTNVSGAESPPITKILSDGRILFVWAENGASPSGVTMRLRGRLFSQAGVPLGARFDIGTRAVDGNDNYDTDNMMVEQLPNGNVVIGYVRNTSEAGGAEPIFSLYSSTFAPIVLDREIQQTDTTTREGPPRIVALDNGGFMAVWLNSADLDDNLSMRLEGRMFNAAGTATSNDFLIGRAVDGFNGYDNDNFSVEKLDDGRVLVGYLTNSAINGQNNPEFSIIDTTKAVGSAGFFVADAKATAQTQSHPNVAPPVYKSLKGGNGFVAVWKDGFAFETDNIVYRIFDKNGNPANNQTVLSPAGPNGISGLDEFDWSSISVSVDEKTNTFSVSWVGADDGNGTGILTSGPVVGVPNSQVIETTLASGGSATVLGDGLGSGEATTEQLESLDCRPFLMNAYDSPEKRSFNQGYDLGWLLDSKDYNVVINQANKDLMKSVVANRNNPFFIDGVYFGMFGSEYAQDFYGVK